MAEKMVKVTLETERMYRPDHASAEVVTVGPGVAEVPAWVAEEWAKPAPDPVVPVDPALSQFDAIIAAINALTEKVETLLAHLPTTDDKPTKKAK